MNIIREMSINDVSELYKLSYGDLDSDAAGWDNKRLIGNIRKNQNFVGNQLKYAQILDYGGGQSSGYLPASSAPKLINPIVSAKSVYATSVLDTQSMRAAQRAGYNQGAFENATKLSIEILQGSFAESIARQLFSDGSGVLGVIESVTANSATDYTLTVTSGSFIQSVWMLNDLVNIDTGTSLFLITDLNISSSVRTVRIVRQNGADIPLAGQNIYKQKSRNQEMVGLKGICDATVGQSLYGVPVGYRWQAQRLDADGATFNVNLARQMDQLIRYQSRGVMVTDIVMSHDVLRTFENSEDAKSIIFVEPAIAPTIEAGSQTAAIKMNGRTVRISFSPYCQNDRAYFFNRDKLCLDLRPDNNDDQGMVGGFLDNGAGNIFFPLHVSGNPNDAKMLGVNKSSLIDLELLAA